MSRQKRSSSGILGIVSNSPLSWAVFGVCVGLAEAPPVWGQCTEQQKLTASDAAATDQFGVSVALSGDTAVVGAFFDDDAGSNSGSAHVYIRSGGVWIPQQKLTASDAAANDLFGISVSVSGDTAVVGATGDADAGASSGAAYVFARTAGVWSQQQKLIASDAAMGDGFGYSVSVSGDTAVVGSTGDDDAGPSSGAVYVFVRSGGVWTEQQKLTASDAAADDQFGFSVSLSGDTVVVGAYLDDVGGVEIGSAYVFVRTGGVWTEQQKLNASDATVNDRFAWDVAVDGDTAVVGAIFDDDGGGDSGSAYVFVRAGNVWTEEQKLTASDGAGGDRFGLSVAVEGDIIVVGSYFDSDAGFATGSSYVFTRTDGIWAEQQKLTASDAAAGDQFGFSVSISDRTAIVGAILDNSPEFAAGSAYVFTCGFEGACCVGGACDVVNQSTCATFGGAFFGSGSLCDDVTCPVSCEADIIPCPAGDGMVDIFDILGVLDAFAGADCCAP